MRGLLVLLFMILGGYAMGQTAEYKAYDCSVSRIHSDFQLNIVKFYSDNAMTGMINIKSGNGPWLAAPVFMQHNDPEDLTMSLDDLATLMANKYELTDRRRVYFAEGYPELFIYCSENRLAVADQAGHYMVYTYDGIELATILYIGYNGQQPQLMKVKKYIQKRQENP